MTAKTFEELCELTSRGCPFCGGALDMVVSTTKGVSFVCHNPKCTVRETQIPEDKMRTLELPADKAEIRKRVFAIEAELQRLGWEISAVEGDIWRAKHGQLANLQKRLCARKNAYEEVKFLKLWDKQRKKTVSEVAPFVVQNPATGERMEVYSIGSKRRAKANLLVEWILAKREMKKCLDSFAKWKARLREYKGKKAALEAEREKILADKGYKKAVKRLEHFEEISDNAD